VIKICNFLLLVSQANVVVMEDRVLSNEAAQLIAGVGSFVRVDHVLLEI